MNTVNVKRYELISAIEKNRKNHRKQFIEAQKGYRAQVIAELDQMLLEARDGKPIRRSIQLPEPQDHTDDYDRELAMLNMSVDEEITLSSTDFSRYVMDNWDWSDFVKATNAYYVTHK